MRAQLREAVRTGEPAARKELFASLVDRVVVHDVDNRDVTVRLYGYKAHPPWWRTRRGVPKASHPLIRCALRQAVPRA